MFLVAAVRYLRTRTAVDADVLAMFATYAAVFAVPVVIGFVPALRALSPLAAVALLAQPLFALRLVRHFSPVSRRLEAAGVVAFAVAVYAIVAIGAREPLVLAYIGVYFVLLELVATYRLWLAGRRRIGVARWRLALAALATGCFALAILLVVIAAGRSGGTPAPATVVLARAVALAAGLGYLGAFMPPQWLRNVPHRAMAFGLSRDLVSAPRGDDPRRLWVNLLDVAGRVLGSDEAAILTADASILAATPAYGRGDGDDGRARGVLARRVVRIVLDPEAGEPILAAVVTGSALFEEDDLELVALLGSMTLRAVEREEALVELAGTRASLIEERARQSADIRFRAVCDANPNGVLVADATGRLVYANRLAAFLFGEPADGLLGRGLDDLIPGVGSGDPPRPGDVPHAGGRELDAHRADGTTFPVEAALSRIDVDEPLTIAVFSDITERRATEEIRENFLGMMSHELRTPVTAIYGGAQLLAGHDAALDPETRRTLLTDIASEAERLQRIVENLIVLARVERGGELGRDHPVLVERLLPTLVDRERSQHPRTRFELNVKRPLPVAVGDDDYVAQILRNLLSNAAKYAGAAGPIEITAANGAGALLITVADRGPGFASEDTDKLFDLYFRSASTAGTAPGAGIGLFVCRRLAEAMGGRLEARVREGGGAEFSLALALYPDEEIVTTPVPAITSSAARASAPASAFGLG